MTHEDVQTFFLGGIWFSTVLIAYRISKIVDLLEAASCSTPT